MWVKHVSEDPSTFNFAFLYNFVDSSFHGANRRTHGVLTQNPLGVEYFQTLLQIRNLIFKFKQDLFFL